MSNFQNVSLRQLTIPGSHDSFASSFKSFSNNDLNIPIIFNPFIKRWAKTQNKTITEQLELGIRYFDIRVEEYNGTYYTVHSLLSQKLYNVLNDILNFIKNHQTEKILVDVNHIYNITDNNNLKNYMKEIFNNYLVKNDINNLFKPLNQVDGNILLFFNNIDDFVFPNDYIHSMWNDTNDINILINKIRNEYLDPHCLNVSQMILTINSSDIVNSLLFCCYPTSLKSLNNQYKEIMYDTLREKKKNIIIVDFVDEEFINICLNFNQTYT